MEKQANHEGICVAIRMRPMNEREILSGQEKLFSCNLSNNSISQLKADNQPLEGQTYYYDKTFDGSSNTEEVYSHIAKDIVKNVVKGINGTIFAYGQTSSGKTHTMLGNLGAGQKGILELAAEDIFTYITQEENRDFLLRVSFVEIYNENIRDLLSDAVDTTVNIREDPRKGVYCEATEMVITDFESILKCLRKGISKRAVESTAMNDTSSRSHTIFKLVIESKESTRHNQEVDGAILVASLNLVDLAGSESVRHTGATGQRAKEGGKINQSLLSLSRVIHALSQPGTHVNFRDSKLTRLLQPSLSGNAKMSVVCCITPADRYLEETRSTLQFASRAKLVTTHATVNEVLDDSVKLKRLQKELLELKEKQYNMMNNNDMNIDYQRVEDEKIELQNQVSVLLKEKESQQMQLERLKNLIIVGGRNHNDKSGDMTNRQASTDRFMESDEIQIKKNNQINKKKMRDTWCPGLPGNSYQEYPTFMKISSVKDTMDIHIHASSNAIHNDENDENENPNPQIKKSKTTITNSNGIDNMNDDLSIDSRLENDEVLRQQLQEALSQITVLKEEISVMKMATATTNTTTATPTASPTADGQVDINVNDSTASIIVTSIHITDTIVDCLSPFKDHHVTFLDASCSPMTVNNTEKMTTTIDTTVELELRKEIATLMESNQSLEEQVFQLQSTTTNTAITTTISDLATDKNEDEIMILKSQIESLTNENKALIEDKVELLQLLEEQDVKVTNFTTDNQVLTTTIDSYQEEIKSLKSQLAESTSNNTEKDTLNTSIITGDEALLLFDEIAQLKQDKVILQEEVDSWTKKYETYIEERTVPSSTSTATTMAISNVEDTIIDTGNMLISDHNHTITCDTTMMLDSSMIEDSTPVMITTTSETNIMDIHVPTMSLLRIENVRLQQELQTMTSQYTELQQQYEEMNEDSILLMQVVEKLQNQVKTASTVSTAITSTNISVDDDDDDDDDDDVKNRSTEIITSKDVLIQLNEYERTISSFVLEKITSSIELSMSKEEQLAVQKELENEVITMKEQLITAHTEMDTLHSTIDTLTTQYESCCKKLQESDYMTLDLSNQLSEITTQKTLLESQLSQYSHDMISVQNQLITYESNKDVLESRIQVLSQEIDHLSTHTTVSAITKDLVVYTEMNVLRDQIVVYESRITLLQQEKCQLIENVNELTLQTESISMKEFNHQKTVLALQNDIDSLTAILIQKDHEISQLQGITTTSTEVIQELKANITSFMSLIHETQVKETTMTQQLIHKEDELNMIKDQLNQVELHFERTVDDLHMKSSLYNELYEKYMTVSSQYTELESKYAVTQSTCMELHTINNDLQLSNTELQTSLTELQVVCDELKTVNQEKETSIQLLAIKGEEETNQFQVYVNQVNSLESRIVTLTEEKNTLETRLVEFNILYEQSLTTTATLSISLPTADTVIPMTTDVDSTHTGDTEVNNIVSATTIVTNICNKMCYEHENNMKESDTHRHIEQLHVELGLKDNEISKYMNLYEDTTQRLTTTEQELCQYRTRENIVMGSEDDMKRRISQLQTTVDLLKGEKDTLTRKLQEIHESTSSVYNEKVNENEQLYQELSTYKKQNEKLSNDVSYHTQSTATLQVLETKHADLKKEYTEVTQSLKLASDRILELESMLGDSKDLETMKIQYETMVIKCQEYESNMNETNQRLKKVKGENTMLQSECSSLEVQVSEKEQQVSTLSQERDALIQERDELNNELEKALIQMEELTQALLEAEQLKSEIDTTTTSNTPTATTTDADSNVINEYISKIESLEQDLSTTTDKVTTLEAELTTVTVREDEMQVTINSLTQEKIELMSQILTATTMIEDGKQETENLRVQLSKQQVMYDDIQHELEAITQSNTCYIESITSLQSEVDILTEAKLSAESTVQELRSQIVTTESYIEEYKANMTSLESSLTSQTTTIDTLTTECTQLKSTITDMEIQLSTYNDKEKSAIKLITSLQIQVAEKDDIIVQIENDLCTSQQKYDTLMSEYDSYKENVTTDRDNKSSSQLTIYMTKCSSYESQLTLIQSELAESQEQIESLLTERNTLVETKTKALKDYHDLHMKYIELDNIHTLKTAEFQETLEIKEKRIIHLEKHKLTKDHLEMINKLKEDRKKVQEDNKTMKRQLTELKKAYEILRDNNNISTNNTATTTTTSNSGRTTRSSGATNSISDETMIITNDTTTTTNNNKKLLVQLQSDMIVLHGDLEASQSLVDILKNKLKDCSKQLQDYESERSAVIDILEQYGIDTTQLNYEAKSTSDVSADISTTSLLEQGLSDAVAKLAEKYISMKNAVSQLESKRVNNHVVQNDKIKVLEEQLDSVNAELCDLKSQKMVLEKRLETQKTSLKSSREEIIALNITIDQKQLEIQELTTKYTELQTKNHELKQQMMDKQSLTKEINTSEIQALEEENLELLKENKELRIEVASYKSQVDKLQKVQSTQQPVITSSVSKASNMTTMVSLSSTTSIHTTTASTSISPLRQFGTDLGKRLLSAENIVYPVGSTSETSILTNSSTKTDLSSLIKSPLGKPEIKRMRATKRISGPLSTTTSNSSSGNSNSSSSTTVSDENTPGECNQS